VRDLSLFVLLYLPIFVSFISLVLPSLHFLGVIFALLCLVLPSLAFLTLPHLALLSCLADLRLNP
jgi:hypothetical protein